jgi:hypothetical protein
MRSRWFHPYEKRTGAQREAGGGGKGVRLKLFYNAMRLQGRDINVENIEYVT